MRDNAEINKYSHIMCLHFIRVLMYVTGPAKRDQVGTYHNGKYLEFCV